MFDVRSMHQGMASRRFRTFSDYVRWGYWIQLDCPCGHVAQVDPALLREQLHALGKTQQVDRAMRHLRCSRCGRAEPNHMICNGPEIWS